MAWREYTYMSEREEFVRRALAGDSNMSALSRRFGVSRKTGYKWLTRFDPAVAHSLQDRSRRPLLSPRRSAESMEAIVCAVRREHPAWGGRKIHHLLRADGFVAVPAASTITGILARNGLLLPGRRLVRDFQRFEADQPNDLWQMDFKGHFPTPAGRCNPLTVLDDHSRFNLCLAACADQQAETVQKELVRVFRCYGLPERMLMDNGSPWGSDQAHPHTRFTAWLIRLGVRVSHGRPYHPQTQGKEERFHRTLKAELLSPLPDWPGLGDAQVAFDAWREVYNHRRPHEAIGNRPPMSRYQPSPRPFPETLPPVAYEHGDEVRQVGDKGRISFRGRRFLVSRAFIGQPVALRATETDGQYDIYYCLQRVGSLSLRAPPPEAEV